MLIVVIGYSNVSLIVIIQLVLVVEHALIMEVLSQYSIIIIVMNGGMNVQ